MLLTTSKFKFLDFKNFPTPGMSYDRWCKSLDSPVPSGFCLVEIEAAAMKLLAVKLALAALKSGNKSWGWGWISWMLVARLVFPYRRMAGYDKLNDVRPVTHEYFYTTLYPLKSTKHSAQRSTSEVVSQWWTSWENTIWRRTHVSPRHLRIVGRQDACTKYTNFCYELLQTGNRVL